MVVAEELAVDLDAYDLKIDTTDGTPGIAASSDWDGVRHAVPAPTVDLDQ